MGDERIEAVAAAIWSAGYAHPSRPDWPEGVQGGSHELFRKMARAALAAAPASAAEPVAWRWRYDDEAPWSYGAEKPTKHRFGEPVAVEPLYAHPPLALDT